MTELGERNLCAAVLKLALHDLGGSQGGDLNSARAFFASPNLDFYCDVLEAPDLLPIEGVDAENIADGEFVIGALKDLNLVACAHIALDDDAQIGTGAQGLGRAPRIAAEPGCC